MAKRSLATTYQRARRVCVAVVGGSVVAVGVLMLVLPGPALLVIPAGLAILGLEFAWARRWLRRVKEEARRLAQGEAREQPGPENSAPPAR